MARSVRMTGQLRRALEAWGKWYSARLDRIGAGSKEDYTGYEQDLFEAIGCRGAPKRKPRKSPFPSAQPDLRLVVPDKRAQKREHRASIREACVARSGNLCECGCGRPLVPADLGVSPGNPELDHFFGRGKAPEAVETCWILRADCHREKTLNRPDAANWLVRFILHCERQGYGAAETTARKRLAFIQARSSLPAAPRGVKP